MPFAGACHVLHLSAMGPPSRRTTVSFLGCRSNVSNALQCVCRSLQAARCCSCSTTPWQLWATSADGPETAIHARCVQDPVFYIESSISSVLALYKRFVVKILLRMEANLENGRKMQLQSGVDILLASFSKVLHLEDNQ